MTDYDYRFTANLATRTYGIGFVQDLDITLAWANTDAKIEHRIMR